MLEKLPKEELEKKFELFLFNMADCLEQFEEKTANQDYKFDCTLNSLPKNNCNSGHGISRTNENSKRYENSKINIHFVVCGGDTNSMQRTKHKLKQTSNGKATFLQASI